MIIAELLSLEKKPTTLKRALHNRYTYAIEDLVIQFLRPMPSRTVNGIEIRALGMRRSGNHAILTWLMRSANACMPEADNIFLNNCKTIENAYRLQSDFRPTEYTDEEYQRITARRNRSYLPTGLLLRSFEDYDIRAFLCNENRAFYGKSQNQIDVAIIRDPLNLFASRLKVGFIDSKSRLSLIDLYLDNVSVLEENSEILPVLYNQWLLSKGYRMEVLTKLSLSGTDIEDNRPASFGPGSSFEGRESKLEKKALLKRWEEFCRDGWFKREILGNSALMTITEKYFSDVLG